MKPIFRLSGSMTLAILFSACGAINKSMPKCPTEKQWGRTPIMKNDQKSVDVQGEFSNNYMKFLESAKKIEEKMTKAEVMDLGFTTESKEQHSCDVIGWVDASQIILGNSLIAETSIEKAMENKKKYSAIRCRAKDVRVRTDRQFAYINNLDICGKGVDITLTVFFKQSEKGIDEVVGVDMNKRPVKTQDRQSSFLRILGDIINPPKLNIDTATKITLP